MLGRRWNLDRNRWVFRELHSKISLQGLTTVLGSTRVVEQPSFSLFLSILRFDFELILGSFLTFWGPNGLFWGSFYFVGP